MEVLLLNGEAEKGRSLNIFIDLISEYFIKNNINLEVIDLKEYEIKDCIGCFDCWTKTPGQCIFDDEANSIAKKMINSDIVIYLTPVVFGGYSYQLKKVIDRCISLISPFFQKVNNEVHHKKRYKQYPSLIGIGINEKENKETSKIFKKLIKRNAINMQTPYSNSEVLNFDDTLKNNKERIFSLLEEGMIAYE